MELNRFFQELMVRMDAEIQSIEANQLNSLAKTSETIVCVERHIVELKKFVICYTFKDSYEEINFFKRIKPSLIGRLLFLKRLFRFQMVTSFNKPSAVQKHVNRKLSRLESFIKCHIEFCRYMHSGASDMDKLYFMRVENDMTNPHSDDRFSTTYELLYSRILAAEQLKNHLHAVLSRMQSTTHHSGITWTGSKTDLIELIYSLHAAEVFNKGSADLKSIARVFEMMFGVDLGNYYRTFLEIRLRKRGQTTFIDILKNRLTVKLSAND